MNRIIDLTGDMCKTGIEPSLTINGLSYDSRKTKQGDLFIALEGNNYDGNSYLEQAEHNGAIAILTSKINDKKINIPILQVEDTRVAMSKIAARYNNNPTENINVIGVTGTNGKTTTVKIIEHILNNSNLSSGSLGTLGFSTPSGIVSTGFTTPESVELHNMMKLLLDSNIFNCVMEVSSHSLEMHRVDDVKYNTAVFTNLSQDHLDFHKNMEKYYSAKEKLFKMLDNNSCAVINIDDKMSNRLTGACKSKIITYGFSESADIRVLNTRYSINSTHSMISVFGKEYEIYTKLLGEFNLYNVIASIASLVETVSIDQIVESIEAFEGVPGRTNKFFNKNKKVIVDYAHTPDAFNKIISTVRDMINPENKIIVIYGCGGNRDKNKRSEIGMIVDKKSDYSIICDDNPRDEDPDSIISSITNGYSSDNYITIRERKEAIVYGINMIKEGDILLVLGKGVEEFQEIQGSISPHSDIDTIKKYLDEI